MSLEKAESGLTTPTESEGPENVYFGSREASSLKLVVGSGPDGVVFHVHWEVLISASDFFRTAELKPNESILVLPLVCRYGMSWLLPELERVLPGSNPVDRRLAEFAYFICLDGSVSVVTAWFEDVDWAGKCAGEFIKNCQNQQAICIAAEFGCWRK